MQPPTLAEKRASFAEDRAGHARLAGAMLELPIQLPGLRTDVRSPPRASEQHCMGRMSFCTAELRSYVVGLDQVRARLGPR